MTFRRPWRWKVAALALCCLACHLRADDCPSLCDCKWKGNKESVICANASLASVPRRLAAGTQVLNLTDNPLASLGRDAFLGAGLLNLQRIHLVRCRLKVIDRHAFRKLTNLVELDLSHNLLAAVPSHVFDAVSGLRELRLSGNPIQRVADEAFSGVPQLVRLELSRCRLSSLEPRAFAGLERSLEWLKLDGNRLSQVRPSTVVALGSLHGLELADNPWNCTCALRPLREWMLRKNVPSGAPPTCRLPRRLAGRSWERLDLDDFACAPHISAPAGAVSAVESHNVTLACAVGGVPRPRVRWLWRNRVVANLSGSPGRKTYLVSATDEGSSLTVVSAELHDAGTYVCLAENRAGRAEASVALSVSRRPGDPGLSGRVLAAGIVVTALFLLASCLVALCACGVRRRVGVPLGGGSPRRDDSYEKIEMNHKGAPLANHASSSPPGVARRRARAEYRGVPCADTEEEEGGYEDEEETPTPSTLAAGARDGQAEDVFSGEAPDHVDLHIPRSVSYLDRREELLSPQDAVSSLHALSPSARSPQPALMVAPLSVPQHVMRKQTLFAGGSLYTSAPLEASPLAERGDVNYPDLLEVSPPSAVGGGGAAADSSFCTLPRKRGGVALERGRVNARYHRYGAGSDSQSPLLPDSRYGSSGGEGSGSSGASFRRSSVDSYSSYCPPSRDRQSPVGHHQRSSSFLNLASLGDSGVVAPRKVPSLPASPVLDRATPLLNIVGTPSASAAAANTYDYHAAQLERFLEEYRSLQEQLCRMKETCDSVRHREAPRYGASTPASDDGGGLNLNPRSILRNKASSVAVTATSASSPMGGALPDVSSPLSGGAVDYGSDLPSYWLPRNPLIRRYSGGDFFQS
ncbi:uncharacterized protein LOC134541379 [Bacillus rossius redtenbacheri]|uniref:uncharacterized protein LOC134541379 n=1 Tax=Bacillus rossius redtenbacheri TaxID=93214 RepID=UPI002FDD3D8A